MRNDGLRDYGADGGSKLIPRCVWEADVQYGPDNFSVNF